MPGHSELAGLIRAFDWRSTSIGPPETWPQSLRTAVGIMLTSRQPIWIGWGPELIYLYNDPYKSIIGGKHPQALGKPASSVWREIWHDIGPMLSQAMGGDEGTYVEAQLLIMERNGYPEETYYTFSYSPIPADDGGVGGIICANTDDTQRVIGERQLACCANWPPPPPTPAPGTGLRAQRAALATNPRDLPFAMIYMLEPDGRTAALLCATGVEARPSGRSARRCRSTTTARGHWPTSPPSTSRRWSATWNGFQAIFPTGAGSRPGSSRGAADHAKRRNRPRRLLIAGLNPFRLFDDKYAGFIDLIAGQIAAAIANAEAYEQERRRAEALAEIDRAKTAFFSNVSHEFRTPLTLMLGPLEDRCATPTNCRAERSRKCKVAHRNALRLLRLVNTLLDFSRIEAGRVRGRFAEDRSRRLHPRSRIEFPLGLRARGLALAHRLRAAAPAGLRRPRHVGKDRPQSVLQRLQVHASQAASTCGCDDVGGRAPPRRSSDTGVGIPAAELAACSSASTASRASAGARTRAPASGSRWCANWSTCTAATSRVESEVGRGTTFTVALPYGETRAAGARSGDGTRLSTATRATAFIEEALRWLPQRARMPMPPIVREAATHRRSASRRRRGPRACWSPTTMPTCATTCGACCAACYDVETVGNGAEALEAIRRERPDLVLSDVMMPVRDGFGLLREIRADAAQRRAGHPAVGARRRRSQGRRA